MTDPVEAELLEPRASVLRVADMLRDALSKADADGLLGTWDVQTLEKITADGLMYSVVPSFFEISGMPRGKPTEQGRVEHYFDKAGVLVLLIRQPSMPAGTPAARPVRPRGGALAASSGPRRAEQRMPGALPPPFEMTIGSASKGGVERRVTFPEPRSL